MPHGFGLQRSFGPGEIQGGGIWTDSHCDVIEVDSYGDRGGTAPWSMQGTAGGCFRGAAAACWTLFRTLGDAAITIDASGVSLSHLKKVAASIHAQGPIDGWPLLCPQQRTIPRPLNQTVPAHDMFPAHPTTLSICRYGSSYGHDASSLHRAGVIAAREPGMHVLVRDLSHLTLIPPNAIYSCPADFGHRDVVILSYKDGSTFRLVENSQGCPSISNGTRAWVPDGQTREALWDLASGGPIDIPQRP